MVVTLGNRMLLGLLWFVLAAAETTPNRLRAFSGSSPDHRKLFSSRQPSIMQSRFNLGLKLTVGSLDDVILNATPNMESVFKINCMTHHSAMAIYPWLWFPPDASFLFQEQYPDLDLFCDKAWQKFLQIFSYGLEDDEITPDKYTDFLDFLATSPAMLVNVIFYSGYAGHYVHPVGFEMGRLILEQTLFGILRGLTFCAKGSGSKYDNQASGALSPYFAPTCTNPILFRFNQTTRTYNNSIQNYFVAASKKLAQIQTGVVTVLFHPNYDVAFNNASHFYNDEFPNFLKVSGFRVLLVTNETHFPDEKCGSGSLLRLQRLAEARSQLFLCENDPPLALFAFCMNIPDHPRCLKML